MGGPARAHSVHVCGVRSVPVARQHCRATRSANLYVGKLSGDGVEAL